MKIPRPCAYQSQNLTSVQYYRGQNTMQYNIFDEYSETVATSMTDSPNIIFQDGVSADTLAVYNPSENTIDI